MLNSNKKSYMNERHISLGNQSVYVFSSQFISLKKEKGKKEDVWVSLNDAFHFQFQRNSQTPKAQFEI